MEGVFPKYCTLISFSNYLRQFKLVCKELYLVQHEAQNTL